LRKLQREFRRTLGTTFAFLGDEIYIKAGVPIPTKRHYGNYPQIEDGVGMVRSFLNAFERMLAGKAAAATANTRTHLAALMPQQAAGDAGPGKSQRATILTGEMFAPILAERVSAFNQAAGTGLTVLAVPNTYFGGDVSVAGLIAGRDYLNVREKIAGDVAIIPRHTIKSDEPVLIDGMPYEELRREFPVPIVDLDIDGLLSYLAALRG
jgi:NifB/MoaA-like Fe-S oxidoreductase